MARLYWKSRRNAKLLAYKKPKRKRPKSNSFRELDFSSAFSKWVITISSNCALLSFVSDLGTVQYIFSITMETMFCQVSRFSRIRNFNVFWSSVDGQDDHRTVEFNYRFWQKNCILKTHSQQERNMSWLFGTGLHFLECVDKFWDFLKRMNCTLQIHHDQK